MAKIVKVTVIDDKYVVSYESGISRTYAKAPKTVMEWLVTTEVVTVNEDTTEVAVNEDTTEVAVNEDTTEVAVNEDTTEVVTVNEDATTEVAVNEDTEVAVKTPTISALDVILGAAFTIMPGIAEVATQALMAIIIGLLMARRGARRIGKTLVPWVLWITGGVADLLIDAFYMVTLAPTIAYTIYNVARYKIAPLVVDTISYGWNLRSEIIAESK